MVPVLDCQRCGALTPASRFRYVCDRLVCTGCLLFEAVQVGEELRVHEIPKVVPGEGLVVVYFAVPVFGCGPAFPPVRLIKDLGVLLAVQRGLSALVMIQIVKVLEEEGQEVCSV